MVDRSWILLLVLFLPTLAAWWWFSRAKSAYPGPAYRWVEYDDLYKE